MNAAPGMRAFLLHLFTRRHRGGTLVCGVGRLETGETFALADDRCPLHLFIRRLDGAAAAPLVAAAGLGPAREAGLATMDGEPVLRVDAAAAAPRRILAEALAVAGVRSYEADVGHELQFSVEHNVGVCVTLRGPSRVGHGVDRVFTNPELTPGDWTPDPRVLSLDIETTPDADRVTGVSLVLGRVSGERLAEEMLIDGGAVPGDPPGLACHDGEAALLAAVAERVRALDPDLVTGWNVIDFDLRVLQARFGAHGIAFNLGRTRDACRFRESEGWGRNQMIVYGRQVLDGLQLVRDVEPGLDDFSLEAVSQRVLGRGKTLDVDEGADRAEAIMDAYRDDRAAFCDYCLEDARLVLDILERQGLLRLALSRSVLTGLPMERCRGSIVPFELLYMRELRARGMVAPTNGVDRLSAVGSPGGLVMAPAAGLYRHVFVFDFKSLYPSIIRTFNLDPLAYVKGCRTTDDAAVLTAPNHARFHREPGILPSLLDRFFASREAARARGDGVASTAYKLIMNSFYGVLASEQCRFAAGQLAAAITGFGQALLQWCRAQLEEQGCRVLYGDTDSLFVDARLDDDIGADAAIAHGRALCAAVNAAVADHVSVRYGVTSRLELEFEMYLRRLLLPSMRGARGVGRAKGYAGLCVDEGGERLVVVGLEAVRRDWTDMAHALQRELLALLFHDAGGPALEACVRDRVAALRAGSLDDQLVYRKRLRKRAEDYTRSSPPHVQAARKLPHRAAGTIRYVITVAGPEPVGYTTAPIDVAHYLSRQVEPIARTIAEVCPFDVDGALSGQQRLFDF